MDHRKYSIGLIIGGLTYGGAERQLYEFATRLDRTQFNPVVFCLSQAKEPYGPMMEKEGIKVYYLERWMSFDLIRLFKLAKLFRKENIDLIHSFLFVPSIYSYFASKISGVKKQISSVRNIEIYLSKLVECLSKFVLRYSSYITFNSYKVQNYYTSKFRLNKNKSTVIYNGVEVQGFDKKLNSATVKSKLGISSEIKIVGTICSVRKQKNIPLFLRISSRLVERHKDVEIVLIGGGPLLKYMINLAKKMKIYEKIHFMEFQQDIVSVINIFDVFILTSETEGLPNVLLEASAAKRPIVCTDVGGCREIVKDGETGFVVPLEGEALFIEKTEYLLNNPDKRKEFGDKGRVLIEKNFCVEKMVKQTQDLYLRVLEQE